MQNQQNNQALEPTLQALRSEIDAIDGQIISLLIQRMAIISKVAQLKKNNQEKFFIRSAREADMIKELIIKSSNQLPKSTIINVWRKIITTANMSEQPLSVAIHNPKNIPDYSYLVKEYYSNDLPIMIFDSAVGVVSALKKGEAQIGIFALPITNLEQTDYKDDLNENWWINIANNQDGIKVFARLPFAESGDEQQTNLVAVAIKQPEASASDRSLLYIELSSQFSKTQLIAAAMECGIKGRILKSAKLSQVTGVVFYLFDVEEFFDENDTKLKTFSKLEINPFVKVLGNYPTPIKI